MTRLRWISQKRALAAALPITILAAGGAVLFAASRADHDEVSAALSTPSATATVTPTFTPPSPTPTPVRYFGLLDGISMTADEWNARKDLAPIAVMIDNHPDAYPHYGLDKADVIYEALVEGGLTRLMAVYWRQDADRIEPVRSARTPFVIWTSELGAWYSHAGNAETENAANAAGQIIDWGIPDLNALAPEGEDAAYYRDTYRWAPHNLVTSTASLREAGLARGYTRPVQMPASWLFKADREHTESAPAAGGIEVNFSPNRDIYRLSQWRWDAATNRYLWFANGGPAKDAISGLQVSVANVVVMRAPAYVLETTHVVYEQVGDGPVQVFMDGKVIEGTWTKADRTSRTRFFDMNGREIALNRGQTFVSLVPGDALVTVAADAAELPAFPAYDSSPPVATGVNDFDEYDRIAPLPTTAPPPFQQPTAMPTFGNPGKPTASQTPQASPTSGSGTPAATPTAGGGSTPTSPPASSTAEPTLPASTPEPTAPQTVEPTNPRETAVPTNPPATHAPADPAPTQADQG